MEWDWDLEEEFWDIDEFLRLFRRRMEKMLRGIERMTKAFLREIPTVGIETIRRIRVPRVDVGEIGDELVVRAELPGVKKEDIDLRIYSNRIDIKARCKEEMEIKEEDFYRKERIAKSFRRVIPLPVEIDPATARAKYENGILEIRAKKKIREEEGRKLEIE